MNNLNLFNEINRVARQYDDQALQLILGKRSKSRTDQAQLCKLFSNILYGISANLYVLNIEQPQPETETEESDDV